MSEVDRPLYYFLCCPSFSRVIWDTSVIHSLWIESSMNHRWLCLNTHDCFAYGLTVSSIDNTVSDLSVELLTLSYNRPNLVMSSSSIYFCQALHVWYWRHKFVTKIQIISALKEIMNHCNQSIDDLMIKTKPSVP